jgi:hypothetical protein
MWKEAVVPSVRTASQNSPAATEDNREMCQDSLGKKQETNRELENNANALTIEAQFSKR